MAHKYIFHALCAAAFVLLLAQPASAQRAAPAHAATSAPSTAAGAHSAAPTHDTLVPASIRYARPSFLRRIFIGKNYRHVWSAPVTVRIFRLKGDPRGRMVQKLGGGQQTKSLQMIDRDSTEWVLRTIDKTVDKAMEAEGIKSGFIKNVTQDMISAAQPYGALTAPPMARALGVVTADPVLVFVPADAGIGEHQDLFTGQLCLLEKREPVLLPTDDVEDTDTMLHDLKTGTMKIRFDAPMLLQARLLDMLLGDWDRHGGQWKWGYRDIAGTDSTYIYPIPVDHDQAFFHSTGALVPMVRPFTMKHLVGYDDDKLKLRGLNRKEWNFDKTLLGGLSEAQWRTGAQQFQQRLTDNVLVAAVRCLPPEIYEMEGEQLLRQLQTRRDEMGEAVMKYYAFLRKHEVKKPEAVVENTKIPKRG